jgi:tRNA-dihydrouridine synthase A
MTAAPKIALAPMLDWTDRHFRYFIRLLSPHTLLYTEMITTGAILHGDADRHLRFNAQEHPVALQLGGSDPAHLAPCAQIAEEYGYDEINLNVGCPSTRVQSGRFGACLMREPQLVAKCVQAMRQAVSIPVTVKCRIGVDEQEDYPSLSRFVSAAEQGGCDTFIVHARKAWLKGLSPKQNRDIPPLQYDLVYRLKQDNPHLTLYINGGIATLPDIEQHLQQVDGVMLGRVAYQHPWLFTEIEQQLFNTHHALTRVDILSHYLTYCEAQLSLGVRLSTLIRPIMCLFNGMPGAKGWRRHLSQHAHDKQASRQVVLDALRYVA